MALHHPSSNTLEFKLDAVIAGEQDRASRSPSGVRSPVGWTFRFGPSTPLVPRTLSGNNCKDMETVTGTVTARPGRQNMKKGRVEPKLRFAQR